MCEGKHEHGECGDLKCAERNNPETSSSKTDGLLSRINDTGTQLTERQFKELRGKYFTIRHPRVKGCGHALDQINEPTFRNCENCWFTFFSTHAELVTVTDEAFQEHGAAFIDKMRGVTYRVQFTRYMATLARFQKEAADLAERDKCQTINSSTELVNDTVGSPLQDLPEQNLTNGGGASCDTGNAVATAE